MSQSQQQRRNARGILTAEQRKEYAKDFVDLDTNADGWLSREECASWIRQKGFDTLSSRQMKAIFGMVDVNRDGKITFDEFLTVMEMVHEPVKRRAHQQFQQMDKNGDGYLTEDELYEGLRESGYSVTRQQIRELLFNLDRDSDGRISYYEFFQMFE